MEQKSLSITTIIQNKDVIWNDTSSNPCPLLLFFFASLCSQTKLIDLDCRSPQLFLWRARLHWCGRRKGPERCFTLPSPFQHCNDELVVAECYNLHQNHRWSISMISSLWSLASFESSGGENPHLLLEVGSLFTEEEEKRGGLQPPWYV